MKDCEPNHRLEVVAAMALVAASCVALNTAENAFRLNATPTEPPISEPPPENFKIAYAAPIELDPTIIPTHQITGIAKAVEGAPKQIATKAPKTPEKVTPKATLTPGKTVPQGPDTCNESLVIGTSAETTCILPPNARVRLTIPQMPNSVLVHISWNDNHDKAIAAFFSGENEGRLRDILINNKDIRKGNTGLGEHRNYPPELARYSVIYQGGATGNRSHNTQWSLVIQSLAEHPLTMTAGFLNARDFNPACRSYSESILGNNPVDWTACQGDRFGGY